MNISALPQAMDVNDNKSNEAITYARTQNTKFNNKIVDMRKQHDLSVFRLFSVMA